MEEMETIELEKKKEPEGPDEHMKKFEALYKENIKYEISIFKRGNHLVVETTIEKDSQNKLYSNYYNLDSLQKSSKFLALCGSIVDIIDTIYGIASNSQIIENHLNYDLIIPVPVKNIKEISFTLKEKQKTQKEIMNDLFGKINKLEKKIEEQNQTIELQGKKINEMEETILYLISKTTLKFFPPYIMKKFREKNINYLKEMSKKEIHFEEEEEKLIIDDVKKKIDSLNPEVYVDRNLKTEETMMNDYFAKLLNYWIAPYDTTAFTLIYKASECGDDSSSFHKYCDGKYETVTLIKGKNNNFFGAYVTKDNRNRSFLFSLTNNKQFPIKKNEEDLFYNKKVGPSFGSEGSDLTISSGCLKNKDSFCEPKSYKFDRFDLIGTKEKNFEVEDYEVYCIKQKKRLYPLESTL